MAYFPKFSTLHRVISHHRHLKTPFPPQFSSDHYADSIINQRLFHYLCPNFTGKRWLSTNAESENQTEFAGTNAYDILGVPQTSSFSEIKASFRKLAKETHPDLAHSHNNSADASRNFVQILAAYEILSDSTKRAHYDLHLLSRKPFTEKHSKRNPIKYNYYSYENQDRQMEVVEWLKWYRTTLNNILSDRRVTAGSSYFDIIERDFYSSLHVAYYGPEIESLDLLPNCFEAEERSINVTSEVLHLVSGRDLFGMVKLSHDHYEKLASSVDRKDFKKQFTGNDFSSSSDDDDAYRDLELHVSGRIVAYGKRVPGQSVNGVKDEDFGDEIRVYLNSHDNQLDASVSGICLGIIKGLGSSNEEGICDVYNSADVKTHLIMKHRTLLVKHLHWYRVGEKFSVCECRCRRARLPPSKFWLFEPRSSMHDIGGWYVETFGRDKKGKNVTSQRCWDGLDTNEQLDERLHPAMYLLALAYRTLDIENTRKGKQTIKDRVEAKISRVLSWCKKRE